MGYVDAYFLAPVAHSLVSCYGFAVHVFMQTHCNMQACSITRIWFNRAVLIPRQSMSYSMYIAKHIERLYAVL